MAPTAVADDIRFGWHIQEDGACAYAEADNTSVSECTGPHPVPLYEEIGSTWNGTMTVANGTWNNASWVTNETWNNVTAGANQVEDDPAGAIDTFQRAVEWTVDQGFASAVWAVEETTRLVERTLEGLL